MNLMSPETKDTTVINAAATNNLTVPLLLVLLAYPTWLVLTTSPAMLAAPLAICAFWLLLRRNSTSSPGY